MRNFSFWMILGLLSATTLVFSACSSSGDDDDSGPDIEGADDDDTAGDDTIADDDADDDVDDDLDDDTAPDDDTSPDDDTTAADDTIGDDTEIDDDTSADDDTTPHGSAPIIRDPMALLSAADPNLEHWEEWNVSTFDPAWERFAVWTGWFDANGDLGGGSLFVSVDGGEPIEYPLPAHLTRAGTWDTLQVGVEFTGPLATPGNHWAKLWVRDQGHNDSNNKMIHYSVGPTTHGIGTTFTDFTLRGFQRAAKDATSDFADYHLEDYAGKVVLIDSFAGWCPPCDAEAGELDSLASVFSPDDFMIFSLMYQDYSGGAPSDADLENWTLYHFTLPSEGARPTPLTGVILNDGVHTAIPYWLADYVPDNFLLDRNHVVRFKMSGWDRSLVQPFINYLIHEDD